ncbi:MAG: hypothetical protein NC082_09710 [Clostridiales bacterium]|nr:hypothetical protein [Clostridiales bacterium]
MKIRRYILLPFMVGAMAATSLAKSSIKAELDSAYVTMGNITAMTVEVVEPTSSHSEVGFIPGTLPREVELVGEASSDTVDLGNDLRQVTRRIILQSFDSGAYTLPPVLYFDGTDTMLSNVVTLKVNPVDVSELEDIHGNADTLKVKSRWYDFLPDWIIDYWGWLLLTLVIVAGGVCAVLIVTKRVKVPFLPEKKPVPPYEMARQRLDTLREQHLCEKGREREYYTELTDILREYIDRRFGINAMEMTSRQILAQLTANHETRPSERLMRQILEVADFVKFAKMRPMPEDNVKSFNHALEFVENTKPQPVPEGEDTTTPPTEKQPE